VVLILPITSAAHIWQPHVEQKTVQSESMRNSSITKLGYQIMEITDDTILSADLFFDIAFLRPSSRNGTSFLFSHYKEIVVIYMSKTPSLSP
jgi:hypothetical protein